MATRDGWLCVGCNTWYSPDVQKCLCQLHTFKPFSPQYVPLSPTDPLRWQPHPGYEPSPTYIGDPIENPFKVTCVTGTTPWRLTQ